MHFLLLLILSDFLSLQNIFELLLTGKFVTPEDSYRKQEYN